MKRTIDAPLQRNCAQVGVCASATWRFVPSSKGSSAYIIPHRALPVGSSQGGGCVSLYMCFFHHIKMKKIDSKMRTGLLCILN
jgi:hypothetical protein